MATTAEIQAAVERDKRIYADDLHRDAVVRAITAEQRVQVLTAEVEELRRKLAELVPAAEPDDTSDGIVVETEQDAE